MSRIHHLIYKAVQIHFLVKRAVMFVVSISLINMALCAVSAFANSAEANRDLEITAKFISSLSQAEKSDIETQLKRISDSQSNLVNVTVSPIRKNQAMTLLIHGISFSKDHFYEPLFHLNKYGAKNYFFKWRNKDSFAANRSDLKESILKLLKTDPDKKLLIFAHSAGGVMALRVLDEMTSEKINLTNVKVFTAAAPVNGYNIPAEANSQFSRMFVGDSKIEIGLGQNGKFQNSLLHNCQQWITLNCSLDPHACAKGSVFPQQMGTPPCGAQNQVTSDSDTHITILNKMILNILKFN